MKKNKEKKNWSTVPLRCKVNRCAKAVNGLCIKVKTDREVSFCRNEDSAPEKTFKYGTERTFNIVNIIKVSCVAFAAAIAALAIFRAAFGCAVLWESGKRSRKRRK